MEQSSFPHFGKVIFAIIWDFFYLPIWWYSFGFLDLARRFWRFIKEREASLGFLVWLQNIFVPMYGQSDLAGRLISFIIRSVQVIFRGGFLLFLILLTIIGLVFYLILPFLIWLAIWHQLS
jgi:hypothetical protein